MSQLNTDKYHTSEIKSLEDCWRDSKIKRRKSGDKVLQTEALWFRTGVFSLEVLASGNSSVVTALH